jgi:dTDP-4-amino-4,6-dideoxygalactose transaminase
MTRNSGTPAIKDKRLYLSPPHMSGEELVLVTEAFQSNWVAPLGPHVDAFEREFARAVDAPYAVALASGTAALHLALELAGVSRGDRVLCSTLTFIASANPIVYCGATPIFVDSDLRSWNMDPGLLEEELETLARRGTAPKAVILVHVYGQSADIDPILDACERHGVTLIEDAAEALGATYKGRAPGTSGRFGVYSFNGNKIITTSGGGMLVCADEKLAARARFLATQARDPAPHYQHSTLGYNYRMSNLLAAVGRAQLRVLAERVRQRRRNFDYYEGAFRDVPGITFMPEASFGVGTRWLTVILVDPSQFGATREDVRAHLESLNLESRPLWKPLHLQPVFAGCRIVGGPVAEGLFEKGLCLPSGSQMTTDDLSRVVEAVLATPGRRAARTPSSPAVKVRDH